MTYRFGFFLALLLHLILILSFIMLKQFSLFHPMKTAGFPQIKIIHSYLFASQQISQTTKISVTKKINKQQSTKINKNSQQKYILKNITEKQITKQKNINTQAEQDFSQGQYNALLIALHNAITKQQQYPENAQMMGEQGTAEIGFTLLPNGDITDIAVIKSCGFALLDQAACAAVAAVSPFTMVAVKQTQRLTINVSFDENSSY